MKLSIIVPIYNVAPYLRKCVDSLLAQDYTDYEIILVDDGSTDNSGAIADEVVSEAIGNRPMLRVIHQTNAGLSAARNAGLAIAQGEYIMYVDSDDYLQPNVLGALMDQVERDQLDVLRFRYQNVRESGEVFAPYKDMTNYNNYSSAPTNGLTFLNERMGTQCYAVQFILRRELALQEQFTPGIYFEDTDWTPRMLLRAERVASTDLVVYNYLWREGSITKQKSISKIKKKIKDKSYILSKYIDYSLSLNRENNTWYRTMISKLTISILVALSGDLYSDKDFYIRTLIKSQIFPLSYHHLSFHELAMICVINLFSARLLVELLHVVVIFKNKVSK